MNTDYLQENAKIREQRLNEKMDCRQSKHFNCAKVDKYASDQNTVYDPVNNLMLYGVNSNMGVLGVSDGTCDQINPLIFTQPYMCGFGAAGGNPCVRDAYNTKELNGIENFESNKSKRNEQLNILIGIILFVLLVLFLYKNK